MVERGVPQHIRSDNGPEIVAETIRGWGGSIGVSTLFSGPGAPWENAYIESFNARLRDELMNGALFTSITEACYLFERWRVESNTEMPHSSLGHLTPAEFAANCDLSGFAPLRLRGRSADTQMALAGAAPP